MSFWLVPFHSCPEIHALCLKFSGRLADRAVVTEWKQPLVQHKEWSATVAAPVARVPLRNPDLEAKVGLDPDHQGRSDEEVRPTAQGWLKERHCPESTFSTIGNFDHVFRSRSRSSSRGRRRYSRSRSRSRGRYRRRSRSSSYSRSRSRSRRRR